MSIRRNLYRTADGRTIHSAYCRRRSPFTSLEWHWADEVSAAQIRMSASALGLRACGICKPLDKLAEDGAS